MIKSEKGAAPEAMKRNDEAPGFALHSECLCERAGLGD
jgi:hypothetical protein